MADQRRNAGNIGDLLKHSLLPVLAAGFDAVQSGEWVYCETHAGYYDYPLELLKDGQQWRGERAWSLGVLQGTNTMKRLGDYGSQLERGLSQDAYPGSLKIVDAVKLTQLKRILGWDIGDEQVASYRGKSSRINVRKADGYTSAKASSDTPTLIFCDPFWTDSSEMEKVKELLDTKSHVIVWYPVSDKSKSFRKWLLAERYWFVEARYRHWEANRHGWAGQDSRGAGLMMKGLTEESFNNAVELARTLKDIFEGQTHSGKPRKNKGGKIVVPQDRMLSLRIMASW